MSGWPRKHDHNWRVCIVWSQSVTKWVADPDQYSRWPVSVSVFAYLLAQSCKSYHWTRLNNGIFRCGFTGSVYWSASRVVVRPLVIIDHLHRDRPRVDSRPRACFTSAGLFLNTHATRSSLTVYSQTDVGFKIHPVRAVWPVSAVFFPLHRAFHWTIVVGWVAILLSLPFVFRLRTACYLTII